MRRHVAAAHRCDRAFPGLFFMGADLLAWRQDNRSRISRLLVKGLILSQKATSMRLFAKDYLPHCPHLTHLTRLTLSHFGCGSAALGHVRAKPPGRRLEGGVPAELEQSFPAWSCGLHCGPMTHVTEHLNEPVLAFARKDFARLGQDLTVQQALDAVRRQGIGEKIVYFYVVDPEDRLAGVLPTRRLLTAPLDQRLSELMIKRVVTIPHTASVLEACELFVLHKFLAIPLIDEQRRIVGIVDVGLLTAEVFDLAEREQMDGVFESIGFRVSQVRGASPFRAFRFRFPWLLTTIFSGTLCALLASAFELTLAKSLVLAFFLTLVLGLGESVSVQSMAVTIQALRSTKPTLRWYARAVRQEAGTALLLGLGCGLVVALVVWLWRGAPLAAASIGASVALSLSAASMFGLSVPAALHALKLDPKVAAGPVTLALTDLTTLLFYFSLGAWLLA
jgi:magnesium transporter